MYACCWFLAIAPNSSALDGLAKGCRVGFFAPQGQYNRLSLPQVLHPLDPGDSLLVLFYK